MRSTFRLAFALTPPVLAVLAASASLALGQPGGAAAPGHRMAPFGGGAPHAPMVTGPLASALEAAKTSDYPTAEKELAAIRGADQPLAQVTLARVLLEQGRYADADRVARAAGGDVDARNLGLSVRAQALFAQGKQVDAIHLLEAAKDVSGRGGRSVRLLLGQYRIATGHRKDADDPLHSIIEDYNNDRITSTDAEGLAIAGRAAYLLRSPKDANKLFNESEKADPTWVDGLLWHAILFVETYDPGHAEETLNQARKIAPHRPELAIMLARVKLEQTLDFDAADKLTKEALGMNPHLAGAFAVRASVALRDSDLEATRAAVTAGLAEDPNDTELLTLRASERFLADDKPGFLEAKKEVFARNPEFSKFYEMASEFAEWEHRYEDIVAMMKEAVALDPDDGKAFAELGLTEMRDGDEQDGLKALQKAWAKDHFNVRVFNTLNLYENTIATAYDLESENVFSVRYPKDEEKVLSRYLPRLLGEAWGSMKARYDFAPTTPVQVELYSNREQFSVRTSGLPNIGIEGVCFGHVLAAMSPKSEPFNWGNVIWHELGHVFAIQLSKSHVPRWFTEGLSEYETIEHRPEWRRELDPQLYQALMAGRLPTAVQMNRAFTHATDGEDMTVAYYASSQMLVFTAEQFGMPKIVRALTLWGEGKRTPEVLRGAFGVSPEEYDTRYRAWQKARLTRYDGQFMLDERPLPPAEAKAKAEAAPTNAKLRAAYALSLLHEHKGDEAKATLDAALKLDPHEPTALYLTARLALAHKNVPEAQAKLDALAADHVDGYAVEMVRAEVADAKKDKPAIQHAFEAAVRFDPTQTDPLKKLLAMAEEEKRTKDSLDILQRWALLDQHDRHVWGKLLGRLVEDKRWEEAAKAGESALFVDVENAAVHIDYGKALAALGQHTKAAFELESATLCAGSPKVRATAEALLAREKLALNDLDGARKARDTALHLDAQSPEAKELVIPDAAGVPGTAH
jgi:predicted Zn-dependent protease